MVHSPIHYFFVKTDHFPTPKNVTLLDGDNFMYETMYNLMFQIEDEFILCRKNFFRKRMYVFRIFMHNDFMLGIMYLFMLKVNNVNEIIV